MKKSSKISKTRPLIENVFKAISDCRQRKYVQGVNKQIRKSYSETSGANYRLVQAKDGCKKSHMFIAKEGGLT